MRGDYRGRSASAGVAVHRLYPVLTLAPRQQARDSGPHKRLGHRGDMRHICERLAAG